MILHHDNTSSHIALKTVNFLADEGIRVLPYPPYSHDLAPCYFFLFFQVKEKLHVRHFSSDEEAIEAHMEVVNDLVHTLSKKLLFPQSEEGRTCCTPNVVQTLVFYSRLPALNRHKIDLVHPLSDNYYFYSRKKVGPVVHLRLYKRWYFTVDYRR